MERGYSGNEKWPRLASENVKRLVQVTESGKVQGIPACGSD